MMIGGGFGRFGRGARRALAAAVLAAVLPAAEASAGQCRQLEAQLAALPSGGGSSTQARRYDDAIRRQQEQIGKAREQGRQAGCGRAMAGRAVAFCGTLAASMERMQGNLAELQRQRARLGGGDSRRERARIRAALDAGGCRAPRQARQPAEQAAASPGRPAQHGAPAAGRRLSGNYRTVCVRTCDGYYFPMSWSVSQRAFERDQNNCEAICPGTKLELHYHRVAGEESEDMVSAATGLPYRDLPTAFRYRQANASTPPGCGCGAAAAAERGFSVIGGNYTTDVLRPEIDVEIEPVPPPQPSARPDPAEDPETVASSEGGPDAEALKRPAAPMRPSPGEGSERAVRVVGPQFLPDPEEAIDLQAQDPRRAR